MKLEELFEVENSPRVSINLNGISDEDIPEIASMLRGLMCSIEGWGVITGLSNQSFDTQNPIELEFSSEQNAQYFKQCVDYYFSNAMLDVLKQSKRERPVH